MSVRHSAGDRVFQAHYGHGTVTAANEYHTVIDFDAHGTRTFATALVELGTSATPAPPKPAKVSRRPKRAAG